MKRSVLAFALIIGILAAGAVYAQTTGTQSGNMPACVPVAPQASQTPMMQDQQQNIAVDENYVYVLRDDEVLKLRKSDLAVVARTDIYGEQLPSRVGRGPLVTEPGKTPLYPSGSRTDWYAPSGDPTTEADRAYDYGAVYFYP